MSRYPTLFVSHGSPMFALEPAEAGPQLRALGATLPKPKAVLVLSPHWMTPGVRVTTTATPETIHDFGGFPAELYTLQYPAPGAPAVAARALELLNAAGWNATADTEWGMDHGAWVPLRHLFPDADVPVLQVSMPRSLDAEAAVHYLEQAPHARRAHPTAEHYLPLPFAFGASAADAPVHVMDGGMTYGILAMDAYQFGNVPEAAHA
jgi:4,5-DOPA dioxygenase extradiol